MSVAAVACQLAKQFIEPGFPVDGALDMRLEHPEVFGTEEGTETFMQALANAAFTRIQANPTPETLNETVESFSLATIIAGRQFSKGLASLGARLEAELPEVFEQQARLSGH